MAPDTGVWGVKQPVSISGMKVSSDVSDVLVAGSLAASVALALYDPHTKRGGMAHCVLPSSSVEPDIRQDHEPMFADTAVASLVAALEASGSDPGNLIATVAGAADLFGDDDVFRLGERNRAAIHGALDTRGIAVVREEVGGTCLRELTLHLADGRTTVVANGVEKDLS